MFRWYRRTEDRHLTSARDGAGRKMTEGFQEEVSKPSLERRRGAPPGKAGDEHRQRQSDETRAGGEAGGNVNAREGVGIFLSSDGTCGSLWAPWP